MFSPEFAQEYLHLRAFEFRPEDPLQKEVLGESSKWSEQLSEHLIGYLRGNPVSSEEANEFIDKYRMRINGSFVRKIQTVRKSFNRNTPRSEIDQFYDGVSPHILTAFSIELWREILSGNQPSVRTIFDTQINLATLCLDFMEPLKVKHEAGKLFKWNNGGLNGPHYSIANHYDSALMSFATEIDALVAVLEACKLQPGFVALPAPHQFEHNVSMPDLNVDILEIDMAHKNVHGIQVKQSMRGISKYRKYNPRFVTMLDGEQDLKNVIFIRRPNGSSTSPVPMPGLYSAHFLANQRNLFRTEHDKKGNMARGPMPHARMRAKLRAREYANLAPSANDVANTRLAEIALKDLAVY